MQVRNLEPKPRLPPQHALPRDGRREVLCAIGQPFADATTELEASRALALGGGDEAPGAGGGGEGVEAVDAAGGDVDAGHELERRLVPGGVVLLACQVLIVIVVVVVGGGCGLVGESRVLDVAELVGDEGGGGAAAAAVAESCGDAVDAAASTATAVGEGGVGAA